MEFLYKNIVLSNLEALNRWIENCKVYVHEHMRVTDYP